MDTKYSDKTASSPLSDFWCFRLGCAEFDSQEGCEAAYCKVECLHFGPLLKAGSTSCSEEVIVMTTHKCHSWNCSVYQMYNGTVLLTKYTMAGADGQCVDR
jgi:hypothetical protein